MMHRLRHCLTLLVLSAVTAGCAAKTGPPSEAASGLSFAAELDGLRTLLLGKAFGTIALAIIGGAIMALVIRRAAKRMRERGWDAKGWVSRGAALGYLVTTLIVADYIVVRFLNIAPLITSAMLGVAALVAGFATVGLVQDLAGGASIALRGTLRRGAHLEIGPQRGIVEWIDPLATAIRAEDGAIVTVPNRLFRKEAFATRSPERAARVTVRMKQASRVTATLKENARRIAVICPYRQASSLVGITVDGADEDTLVVTFRAPSEAARPLAERFVLSALGGPKRKR